MSAPSTTTAEPATAPVAPPRTWFHDPKLGAATPLTVTPEGKVYGHLATWGKCHRAFGHGPACQVAPRSRNGYAGFMLGGVLTAEGATVATGPIILGTPHADPAWNRDYALEHYSNTGRAVADVCVGEDRFGIWVAGALRPTTTPAQVRELRASPLSGDWRTDPNTRQLELVGALAVNQPGFSIPRPQSLIASATGFGSVIAVGVVPNPIRSSAVRDARSFALRALRVQVEKVRRSGLGEPEFTWRELAELDVIAFGETRRLTLAQQAQQQRLARPAIERRVRAFARERERSLVASMSAPEAQVQPWAGPIVFEGQVTGDGRIIGPDALSAATFPLPLRWSERDVGGHDGALIVGRIDSIERRPGGVLWAEGVLDLGSIAGKEVARQIAGGFAGGVSVDLDSNEASPFELNGSTASVTTSARVRAATIVGIPAFAGAQIALVGQPRSGAPADDCGCDPVQPATPQRAGQQPVTPSR